ncbi:MAG: sialate O-acetylesterase [Kiritimatiellales bacterium]
MKLCSASAVLFAAFCLTLQAVQPLTPADPANPPAGVERIELFLLMGQSNMKGRGEVPAEQTLNPRIVMMHLKNDQWYFAQHPLHLTGNPVTFEGAGNEGVGPGLAFARAVAEKEPKVMVGLIPCAVGGTRLDSWMKGAKHYENAVRRARLALGVKSSVPVVLRGALWLQGEADTALELQSTYQARLTRMVGDLRADLGVPDLPFIAATLGEFTAPVPSGKARINQDLLTLPTVCPRTACADARDLKEHIGDKGHYSAASADIIGAKMAAKYMELK